MNQYLKLNKSFINGQWIEGETSRIFVISDKYTNEVLTEVKIASKAQVEEAYIGAKKAQISWAKDNNFRKEVIEKTIKYFLDNKDSIMELLIAESGSTVIKSEIEFGSTIGVLSEALKMVDKIGKTNESTSFLPGKVNESYRLPLGIISSIAPFNFPLYLSMRTIAPALALGNAVVHKADLQVGLVSGSLIAKAFESAGLPSGIFQSVLTKSSEIGNLMVEHPYSDFVSFTGSTEVGREIGGIAGSLLKPVALELGGNGPFVILDDADIDQAVDAAIFGKFLHQGQICMITNRIIVHEKVYDEFVEKFVARVKALPYGDPSDPRVVVGPLINERQIEKALGNIEKAKSSGIKMLTGGERDGNIIIPTVFVDVKNDSELAQTELFAPIASIIKASSNDEAIEFANDTIYGLSSAIFSKNEDKAREYALQLKFGMTHINDQTVNDEPNIPFGGMRQSGVGRFGNPWIVEEFTETKWVSVQKEKRQYPF